MLDNAYKGTGQFKRPVKNIRALGALYPEVVQLVTLKRSNIKTFKDLKNKSVSSGSPGAGSWIVLGEISKLYGMDRNKDLKEDYSSFTQSTEKIKDGNLTASLIVGGVPISAVVELSNGHPTHIVDLKGKEVDDFLKRTKYYAKYTMPANTYKGQDKPVETIAVRAVWATHKDLPEAVAYEVVKQLYENVDTLAKVHPKGKEITLNTALESITIPLHPGAERYYREKGIKK